ncbi:MAG: hypothetical protein HY350_02315 [Candidatus Omnitrophica bacterium]|nr:hypothetical protein [Candidatus Omnitrophota bacterium]
MISLATKGIIDSPVGKGISVVHPLEVNASILKVPVAVNINKTIPLDVQIKNTYPVDIVLEPINIKVTLTQPKITVQGG